MIIGKLYQSIELKKPKLVRCVYIGKTRFKGLIVAGKGIGYISKFKIKHFIEL